MTTHPQTLLIAGYYGFGNAGDEAILSAIISDLRALRSDLKMTVVSGNPPETEAAHGVAAVLWTDIEKIMQAVAASDLVILGGGGLFHDYWGFDPDSLLTQHHAGIAFFGGIPLLASLLDKPLMMYAVGVGPLFSAVGQAHTRAAFDAAAFITVRDAESRRLLELIGVPPERVRVTTDPAFRFLWDLTPRPPSLLGGKGPGVGGQEDHPLLAVALREWNIGVLPDYWERQVAEALDVFVERHGGAIVLVPFQEGKGHLQNDAAVAERVRGRMRNNERTTLLPQNSSVREKAAALSQCDLVLGMRLHSLIFALSSAVPAVGLVYDPKVRGAMKMAGVEDYAIDLGAVTAARLAELMEEAFAERGALSARLKESASALSESAQENARLAVALLDGAKPSPVTPATVDVLKRLALSQTRKRIEQEAQARMLAAQSAERGQAVADLRAQRAQLEARANEHARAMAELQRRMQAELEDRDRAIAELGTQADERERVIGDLRSAAAQEAEAHNRAMADVRSESHRQLNDRDRTVADLQAQVGEREQALGKIHASKHWKLMSLYWRAYDGVSAAYSGFREALRKLLPVPLRRSVVQAYRRARPPRLADQPMRIETLTALDGSSPARHDVVCFPVIDWEFRFQRPQQLAMQFARDGHRCFYLRTTLHQNGPAPLLQNIAGRVVGVQLPGAPDLNIYSSAMSSAMLDKFISALDDVRKTAGIAEAVCIVDLPFWTPLALAARERWGWKIIYDCMDEHGGFATNSPIMLRQEETLVKESDLIVATSRTLHRKIAPHARRALVLPNAVDFDHFNRPRAGNPLAHLSRPIIGFYGAISDWFDVEMVRAAAARRPDWQFVLIGDTFGADVSPFKSLRNVHLMGEKPYDDLPAYLQQFDVACIPFLITQLTRAINPVKFYEYLSAGKPVVSVELPELEPLREYFYPARSADEFEQQIEIALRENDPARAAARIEFARANTWECRYQLLKDAVRQLYGKVAVIVVSYNNLDYLRPCLETLLAKTERPNFEVIVVDNGSDDSVVEYLQDSAKREPRLQAILNGENLGFARANNIGIQAASEADFVVLLNDDTVLTRGWLTRLIRHLDDPAVGLVGPVTNCAANEAQINTNYQSLDDMESFAESTCRARAGRAFDIPMLAMYCVAMRKSLIDQIGLLDERFETGMFEDDDFSLRVRRAGFRIVCAEDAFVHHWGRASFSRMDQRQYDRLFDANRKKFEAKWELKWQPHRYRSQS